MSPEARELLEASRRYVKRRDFYNVLRGGQQALTKKGVVVPTPVYREAVEVLNRAIQGQSSLTTEDIHTWLDTDTKADILASILEG